MRRLLSIVALLPGLFGCNAQPARSEDAPLMQERTIALQDVAGRIDHLAVDAAHGRLFVAELGNGTVDAVDLRSGAVVGRISGLHEPQGIAYLPDRDELAVASGGDGTVRFFRAADLAASGMVALGDDADNLRVAAPTGRLVAGVGSGELAIIDPASRKVVGRIPLAAHPEGFQLDGDRAFVNLPDKGRTVVVDLATGRETATWPNGGLRYNYPLATDRKAAVVAVVYRLPARLVTFDAATGARLQVLAACGDADDVFFDGPRRRLYVICGGGAVDVFEVGGAGYSRIARVATRGRARTGLYSPQLDRLYVAAPASDGNEAAILVFRPAP